MDFSLLVFLTLTVVCLIAGFVSGFLTIGSLRNGELKELRVELNSQRELYGQLLEEKARAETLNAELESRQAILKEQFKASANSILLELAKTNREKHSEELDTIIAPLKKQIEEFKKETKSFRETDIKEKATLKQEISNLNALSTGLGEKTEGLSQVLRGDQRTQGVWGEIVLRALLEKSGLKEGVNFFEQGKGFNLKNEEGRPLKPDVLIKMPSDGGDKSEVVIVDSKVSLAAYNRYVNTKSPEERKEHLQQHLLSIRNHIANLSEKRYETTEGLLTVDYVMLFMGIESALITAMDEDPSLQDLAIEKNVVLVSQSMLLPALRSVAYLWRRHSQIENIKTIIYEVDKMYDGFLKFGETLNAVKKAITHADSEIDLAAKRLTSGRGNLTRRAEKIRELSTQKGLVKD
ncbi:MAG: DNA recombination protein RmuC [Pseudohongiellaceae bacterium]